MRPTFLGFETCKRGIATNQKVMDIVGQNMTNWDTPGYTRQRVDIVSLSPSTYATRYGSLRTGLAGMGAEMTGVSQVRDPYLDKRFREEYGDASYNSQAYTIMSDLESMLKEDGLSSSGSLYDAIASLGSALDVWAEHGASETEANSVSVAARNIVQVLHELSSKLDNVTEQQTFDMEIAVNDYNNFATKIAELNKTIRNDVIAHSGSSEYYGPNELLDDRNLMLDELSKYGDVDVANNKDGTVTVKVNGHTMISGDTADMVVMDRKNDGTVALRWNSTGKDYNTTTGSLKAYTDFINGRGPNMSSAGETSEYGIRYYRDKLDTFASTFVKVFNGIVPHAQPGTGVDGIEGVPVTDGTGAVQYKELFGARVPATDPVTGQIIPGEYTSSVDVPVTASNITISDAWEKDSSYVMFGTGDAGNANIANLMKSVLEGKNGTTVFTANGETFQGTFQEYVNDYVIQLGEDTSYYKSRAEATANICNEMLDRRDEVSAVSRDEETQTLMMYNKAYQAIARVLTTLDEALDVLINKTGLVGR